MERFIHAETPELPTLLKAGLVHVQFETIHPFLDGNGRLGRLLVTFMLCAAGMLREPILYLSLYLKTHRQSYYELLQSVRDEGRLNTGSRIAEIKYDTICTIASEEGSRHLRHACRDIFSMSPGICSTPSFFRHCQLPFYPSGSPPGRSAGSASGGLGYCPCTPPSIQMASPLALATFSHCLHFAARGGTHHAWRDDDDDYGTVTS
jgi:hypothetical protein